MPTATATQAPVSLRFPRPTGLYPVGTTELHLVDSRRDDPYVPGQPRELMISLWYPSSGGHTERAPYGWKRDLNVPAGQHYTFIDHQVLIPWFRRFFTVPPELIANTIGTVNAKRILRSLRTYIPAFFDQHLRGRPSAWQNSPRHPDVTFVQ